MMPVKAPTFRPRGAATRQEQRREHDRHRRKAKPWRQWYKLPAWLARRAGQLTAKPYCERHKARGEWVAATVANHRRPHRGDWNLFIGGELESLCKRCHDRDAQRDDHAFRAEREGDRKSPACRAGTGGSGEFLYNRN